MKCCCEITSGCLLGATHLCAESQRWVMHSVTFSLHKQDICMFTNEQTQLHLFFLIFSAMDMFPSTKICRVIELLTWNHSGLLALLPHNFALMYCCWKVFPISFNVAFSSVCVSKILAPLPTEPLHAVVCNRSLRRLQVLPLTSLFSGL